MSQTVATPAPVLLRANKAGVATLTLNRPAQFNALSEALIDALQGALDDIARDEEVRVVVLRAAGRAFCAGHDLKQMRETPEQAYYNELFACCGRMMQSILRLPQPVIARVQGVATAAGCQLVATCDLAVATSDARFATSGINLGLFCSTPAVAVSRVMPRKHAAELLLRGNFLDAARACELGLINQVVPAEELDAAVGALAQELAQKSPVALRTGKQMFYRQLGLPLEEAYDYAAEVMAQNMMAEDATRGIDAFLDKRSPSSHRR